jgi:hypothetical protein
MYGSKESPGQTSLCPYCQTILWGTIFLIAFSWAMLLGWIVMRIGRTINRTRPAGTQSIVNYLERETEWMRMVEEGPSRFTDSPFFAGLAFTIMGLMGIVAGACTLAMILICLAVIGFGAWNIKTVCTYFFEGICHLGWIGFHGFYYVGWALDGVVRGIVKFFTDVEFWTFLLGCFLWFLKWFGIVAMGCMILGLASYGITRIPVIRRLGKRFMAMFDTDAQVVRARARQRREIKPIRTWTCTYCNYNGNPDILEFCSECATPRPAPKLNIAVRFLLGLVRAICWPFFRATDMFVKIKQKRFFVLGSGWSVFIEYLWAIKSGICPVVHFVNPAAMQAEAQASAQERMDREKTIIKKTIRKSGKSLGAELLEEIEGKNI